MFNLPIDTSAMTFLVGASAEPIRERGTNRPRTDTETGEPLFAVQLVALIEGRANVITVKVPGEPPAVPQSTRTPAGALLVRFVLRPVWLWRVELAAVALVAGG